MRVTLTSRLYARRATNRCFHTQQLVRDALQEARDQLQRTAAAASSTAPCTIHARDAKPLLAHALDPSLRASNDVFLHLDRALTHSEAHTLTDALTRRCQNEPLAYITGTREFWSLAFAVSRATLIPRSDSEVLIETLTELYADATTNLRILDIGTGSGCLLVSALREFPHATGVGIDISLDALAIAKQNAESHRVADRATFVHQDLCALSCLSTDDSNSSRLYRQFDVVLCNPPYIPRSELALVASDVLAYEPHSALFSNGGDAGSDEDEKEKEEDPLGLRMYRHVAQSIVHLLARLPTHDDNNSSSSNNSKRPTVQRVVLEVGSEAQAYAVCELFAAGDTDLRFERFLIDARGRYRGLVLQRSKVEVE